ncbi:helix-turn-helix transcriptional regulator [Chengkuizengella marina]|uniref:WYL domain-containing protein n=1 Tax=Chengkuizengella marina TaxID=2507566 RepID=A0A6N9Q668_9BACL|nr:WYL domain-containing protein [Chengkuizengella marina]NBI30191.1 WYL domain-containing protein [Chengkuizengella marina]
MNKSERLNDMLQFINDKKAFNLKDLMEKYNISRSTAIRDVQSLELLGMPIYAEQGRNGKYLVLDNRILSPITFTVDEMYAMYFAMLTLKRYKAKPFEYEIIKLENKFNQVLPSKVKDNIEKMKGLINLEITNHSNFNPYLKDLIQGIVEEKIYLVSYLKNKEKIQITGQFIKINSKFGQWYSKIYNIDIQKVQNLRCDKILSLEVVENKNSMRLEYLLSLVENHHKQTDAIEFSIIVTDRGKDLYDKEHYPSMSIQKTDDNYIISGYYNWNEEDFISDYFLRYGKSIISISPPTLKASIQNKLHILITHLNKMNLQC